MAQKAPKFALITEKVLLKDITKIICAAGATGYAVTAAGGRDAARKDHGGVPRDASTFLGYPGARYVGSALVSSACVPHPSTAYRLSTRST
ncbi:hypothetical protein [Thiocapsa bogorovii]|uniref:hypothetical protein n=1 Tax=Thiocapsa bogorovii TaxID=521689 RepID=UPI001E5B4C67|nr:hypothetical protein [Thiocapsa bogorovii]UHD18402.1 hypothetical protein LT988_10355 [Thiocapsa bogorovii]